LKARIREWESAAPGRDCQFAVKPSSEPWPDIAFVSGDRGSEKQPFDLQNRLSATLCVLKFGLAQKDENIRLSCHEYGKIRRDSWDSMAAIGQRRQSFSR